MKILYIYNDMPGAYQQYLKLLLQNIQTVVSIKTLTYTKNVSSDYSVPRYNLVDQLHRFLFKLGLIKTSSIDVKKMLEFDIIHVQHSYLWQRLLPLFLLNERPKIVLTLRGGDTYLKPWTFIRMAKFFNNASQYIDAFIVMSKHQKHYLQRWGVAPEKIFVIPISFGSESNALPKHPNEGTLKLISAFRMTWEKNISGHIQFAKHLKDKGVNFSYDIFGEGHDLDQLYFLVDQFNLADEVNIKHKIKNEDLLDVYSTYDFCVQLSISESLGMTVIEAQSRGVPCIVTDVGGLSEAVKMNQSGLVGSLDDLNSLAASCVELWNDRDRYFSFSKTAINHVNDHYTLQHEIESLENLYRSLL